MKRIIMMLTMVFLCFSLFFTTSYCYSVSSIPDAENTLMSDCHFEQFVPYVEDDVVVRMDNSGITLIGKNNPVFGQDDIETNFVNYASGESRNTLPNVYTDVDSEVSNVVGVVLDFETDEPIGEANVSANGNDIVVTDIDGRFQITNMPDGVYDWTVQANGYQDGIYENYVVTSAGGTNIYRFYLSKDMEYVNAFEEYTGQSLEDSLNDDITPYVTHPNPTMTSVPDAYDEVKVLVNGVVKTYDRDEYLWYTINAEQYLPNKYMTTYHLTESDLFQVYCAQAVISNTYIEFGQKIYIRYNGSYDIKAGSDHAFNPNVTYEAIIKGVSGVFYTVNGKPSTTIIYYTPSNNTYKYLCAEWFSSCYNQGTKDHFNNWDGVKGIPCKDYFEGAGGHRRGYCQSGATQLIVVEGERAIPVAKHYFTDVDHRFATLVARPANLS